MKDIDTKGPEEKEDLNCPDNTSEHTIGQSDHQGKPKIKNSIMKVSSEMNDGDNQSCFVKFFSCGGCKSNV